ncbi:hypothetical protein AB6896_10620 [Rahnella inusitata]|uniref:hypothetical protein n=1 Tax=Rahnella inusitata TaxID=58169 RepID=UPI0039BE7BCE
MEQFTNSIRMSLRTENWYAALFMALAMPDICGSIENPRAGTGARYKKWFNEYLKPLYDPEAIDVDLRFSGADCYSFRCSCLHSGMNHETKDRTRKFIFTPPPGEGNLIHMNSINGCLQLQIDIFCEDVASQVDRWTQEQVANPVIQLRISELMKIHWPDGRVAL